MQLLFPLGSLFWNKHHNQGLVFRSTRDIIDAAKEGRLPDQIMFTFHPQRWHSRVVPWIKELVLQNVKNVVKGRFLVREG